MDVRLASHFSQFTQPDSLVADPLHPAAWNRFAYAYDSPDSYIDPSGNVAVPLIIFGAVAFTGAFIGGASYIANHPGEDYARSLEFYKAVIGGELLAASLFLPFSSSAPIVIRGAVVASHVLTLGSDVRENSIARDQGLFLPRSSWKKYLGNAMGAAATGGLLHWTVLGPVWSAVAGGATRRLTINLLETNSVDPWEVGIDAAVSGVQAWFFGQIWPTPKAGLDFTKPPLGEKVYGARDIVGAESGVLFGAIRNWLLELHRTPYVSPTPTP